MACGAVVPHSVGDLASVARDLAQRVLTAQRDPEPRRLPETQGGWRAAVGRALAVDSTAFQPFLALRAAAGIVLPVAIGTAVGHPAEGSIAAAGALPAGVAGLGGGFRSRAGVILATTLGMAISTFVGGLVAGHVGPTLAVLALWGFGAGIVVVLGRAPTIVGTQAVMGLVVFGRFPGTVAASAVHGAWVLAGGGLQGVLAATLRSPQRFAAERRILGRAYAELAMLARDPSRSSLTAATEAAAPSTLIGRRAIDEDVELLRGLADEATRVRLEIQALATVHDNDKVSDVLVAAAGWLSQAAVAIRRGVVAPEEDAALAASVDVLRAERDRAPAGRGGTTARYTAARAAALLGQLRAIDRLTNALSGVRRLALPRGLAAPVFMQLPRRAADSMRQVHAAIRDPASPPFRHAMRLAVVLPATEGLSHLLPGQRGYWVTLTAAVVLKPDYAATAQRGLARVIGTGLGVLIAGLLVVAAHPSGEVIVLLLALSTWAAYTGFAASYALFSFAATTTVVLLLAPLGGNELSTALARGLDTLVGGAVAMFAYALWPTWEGETLNATMSRLLAALASYTEVLLSAYVDPGAVDRSEVGSAATAARRARMAAEASIERAASEPPRAGADLDTATGVLSATRRIVFQLHALRVTIDDAKEHVAVPEVATIRDAIVSALRDLAAGRVPSVGELRELQRTLESQPADDPGSLRARRATLVAAYLDPLVDSVDTVAHVMVERRAARVG